MSNARTLKIRAITKREIAGHTLSTVCFLIKLMMKVVIAKPTDNKDAMNPSNEYIQSGEKETDA